VQRNNFIEETNMGKTYKKIVRNKFEKKKFNNLKRKQQFIEDYENEEDEVLSEMRRENRTREYK